MKSLVFYSWQSDLSNATNRGFIGKALENAAKAVRNDDSIEVEPVIDRDTTGVPGSPDIASTIFAKIDLADVVVFDVSIINEHREEDRPTPNPNVLIELGYALKSLGASRILLVMNTAFGEVDLLPFDLHKKRAIRYALGENSLDKAEVRKSLENTLELGLRAIFQDIAAQASRETAMSEPLSALAQTAVLERRPNASPLTKKFMKYVVSELDRLAPDFSRQAEADDLLIEAIEASKTLVIEFSRLAEAIAEMDSSDVAVALYKGFDDLLNRYNITTLNMVIYGEKEFDFYKFVGYELFASFFSFLIKEERYRLIGDLLSEEFYIKKSYQEGLINIPFTYVSQYAKLLIDRGQRLHLNTRSLFSDLLKERHTKGELAEIVGMGDFVHADMFLYFAAGREGLKNEENKDWLPHSTLHSNHGIPKFLAQAIRTKNANALLHALGVKSIKALRERIANRAPRILNIFGQDAHYRMRNPFSEFNPGTIGTK